MAYVDGFVLAVPAANREEFIEHAEFVDGLIKECGADRIVECWDDDVPDGEVTDFRRARQGEGRRNHSLRLDRMARQGGRATRA